jgi:Protein of unknown function (DUF429)
MRIIAIDWSGRAKRAQKHIWLAEAADEELVRLECGRGRDEIANHLIEIAERQPDLIVGLDFAFSFPSWFLAEQSLDSPTALWALTASVDAIGEGWLRACEPPFWGRPYKPRPSRLDEWRTTELTCQQAGWWPRSVFQVGGAGAVGTGSLRGMPLLHRLREAGFSIWPFDDPIRPVALELYPRALTGSVTKSRGDCRERYLQACYPALNEQWKRAAIESEDAFDAAVSALRMARQRTELLALPAVDDESLRREGLIWYPGLFPA